MLGHGLDRESAVGRHGAGRAIGGRVRACTRPADKLDRTRPEPRRIRIESQHELRPAFDDVAMKPVAERRPAAPQSRSA